MTNENANEVEEVNKLKQDPRIKSAINQCLAVPNADIPNRRGSLSIYVVSAFIIFTCTIFYFLLQWYLLPIPGKFILPFQKLLLAGIFTTITLAVARSIKTILKRRIDNARTRYNAGRITDLIAGVLIFFLLLSLLFANWYATMVSFGIISLVVGLALQNPITSFFAWLYVLVRKPYAVGDRIRIGNVKGDVIELGYFDTTLWEFGGEYLSGDHPSGRLVRFSNSKVFSEFIYNYSWPLFPFIWNEIKLFVAYETDLSFVSETVRLFVEKEVGETMVRRVKRYKRILDETPINKLEVREYPSIILRSHENTWVEVVVRYLVEPKLSGQVKNQIFKNLMEELRKHPEKVKFPRTDMR